MPYAASVKPLVRVPLFHTRDSEAMRHELFSTYGATKFEPASSRGFEGKANYLLLNDISLGFCGYGSRAEVEFPEADFVRLQLAIKGSARTSFDGRQTAITAGQLCLTPANYPMRLDFGVDYQQLILRIKSDVLEQKLALLLGARPRKPLQFESGIQGSGAKMQVLQNLFQSVAAQLAADAEALPPLLLRELESALVVAFLTAIPHSLSAALNRQPTDLQVPVVTRIEEYIEANSHHPITIEKLVQIGGVSARSIFTAFQKTRGYSPFSFLKMVRLKRARGLLGSPDSTTSVTGIAFVCGFGNLGHFAKDYREMFGELPSATLAKSRA
jgi:AraC-like DNA-binding protein